MSLFLVERYVPDVSMAALMNDAALIEGTSSGPDSGSAAIKPLGVIWCPEDEMCFQLVGAESSGLVAAAYRRAAVSFERIVEICTSELSVRPSGYKFGSVATF